MTKHEMTDMEVAYWRTIPGSVMILAIVLSALIVGLGSGGYAVYRNFNANQQVRSDENACLVELLLQPTLERQLEMARRCRGLFPDLEERYAQAWATLEDGRMIGPNTTLGDE